MTENKIWPRKPNIVLEHVDGIHVSAGEVELSLGDINLISAKHVIVV